MITSPKIEELAFKGVCRWHVFNTGYASSYTLEVPNGGFILLRQIIFHPFYQGANRNAQLLNVAHQLSLVEQGSKTELVYQFRNPVSQVTDVNGIGAVHNVATTEATILETWGVFITPPTLFVCVTIELAVELLSTSSISPSSGSFSSSMSKWPNKGGLISIFSPIHMLSNHTSGIFKLSLSGELLNALIEFSM